MKKTFQVNINGYVFHIDDDAYNLLSTYLDQLHKSFPGNEGKEIVTDIESRIAEIFNENIKSGARVIVLDDVNSVIKQMGQPEELSDEPQAEDRKTDNGEKSDSKASDADASPTPPPFTPDATIKRLYRRESDKVFGGVLGGLGVYLNWNPTIMRVFIVILALCTKVWPLAIVYLIAWMIIPAARSPRQILEMNGMPVTVGSVGQTILGTTTAAERQNSGSATFNDIMSVIGKIILGFFGVIGLGIALGMFICFIMAASGLFLFWGWGNYELLGEFDMFPASQHPILGGIGMITLSLACIIPAVALIWCACIALFKVRGASRSVIISAILIEILLIITTIVMHEIANIDTISINSQYHSFSTLPLNSFSTLQLC